jgi:hypothetical protein
MMSTPPIQPGSHDEGGRKENSDLRAVIRIAGFKVNNNIPCELATLALTVPVQFQNSAGHAQHVATISLALDWWRSFYPGIRGTIIKAVEEFSYTQTK